MTAMESPHQMGSPPPVAPHVPVPTALSQDLEAAHGAGVAAAVAGLGDAGLGALRLAGSAVPVLAEAAVTSATPFLRAPLLARMSAALVLHPPGGELAATCPTCATPVPCSTAQVLQL